jgi:hypothetical protein
MQRQPPNGHLSRLDVFRIHRPRGDGIPARGRRVHESSVGAGHTPAQWPVWVTHRLGPMERTRLRTGASSGAGAPVRPHTPASRPKSSRWACARRLSTRLTDAERASRTESEHWAARRARRPHRAAQGPRGLLGAARGRPDSPTGIGTRCAKPERRDALKYMSKQEQRSGPAGAAALRSGPPHLLRCDYWATHLACMCARGCPRI